MTGDGSQPSRARRPAGAPDARSRPFVVFADGGAKRNPGPGGWGALVVTPAGHVSEYGGGSPHTTNNKMELGAVIAALDRLAGSVGPVQVYTDSTYVIRGITQWIHAWRRRGWKTVDGSDVLNRELWERLSALVAARDAASRVSWTHVPGHSGIPGNERVDAIADSFARGTPASLYDGPLSTYGVAVLDLPAERPAAGRRAPGTQAAKPKTPHSYLSVVDGRPMRHATWAECERRVRGKSGARFKKALSAAEEVAILGAWGFSAADL